MSFARGDKKSSFVAFIIGIIFLVVGFIGGISLYNEYVLICNSSDNSKGVCIINEKGLFGESNKTIPSTQIVSVRSVEHISRRKSYYQSNRYKYYYYSLYLQLDSGKEIPFPPWTTVSAGYKDIFINQLTALKISDGTEPVYFKHDNRMMGVIIASFFGLAGIIFVFISFFR